MDYKIILASGSPRRQQLMRELRIPFLVRTTFVPEDYPDELAADDVAEFLAGKKGKAYQGSLADDELVVTADTTVVLEGRIMNKPTDATEAQAMLRRLSGQSHRVITGVGLTTAASVQTFTDTTTVHFRELTKDEIDFYVKNYQPYDKAGGYAIQEWIGMVAIEGIVGSYFNVVGLPVEKLYRELERFNKIRLTSL